MNIPNAALAYREAASLGASPLGVVVLLYDRLVQDIHRSVAAMRSDDVEARSAHVNHALLILQELQGMLDFSGGEAAARQLDTFYSHIRGKLLEAQIRRSPDLLLQQAQALLQVRACWAQIDGGSSEATPESPVLSERAMPLPDSEEALPARWGA